MQPEGRLGCRGIWGDRLPGCGVPPRPLLEPSLSAGAGARGVLGKLDRCCGVLRSVGIVLLKGKMPVPWHQSALFPHPPPSEVLGTGWAQPSEGTASGLALTVASGPGSRPRRASLLLHPQRGAEGHLCISQVFSHPGELQRRWQLWLQVVAELARGLLMMFVKTLNEDHTREARASEVS